MTRLLPCLVALCVAGLVLAADAKLPVPVSGKADPAHRPLDEAIAAFLDKHDLPGCALACVIDGKVVYKRGFGLADRETKTKMQPDALFRLSSLSKPITAAAVMTLVEKGKVSLDAKVFDFLGLKAPAKDFDARWKDITVRMLLEQRSGWDHSKSQDPLYYSPLIVSEMRGEHPASAMTTIRFMLKRKLHFDPGARYGYANLNYTLLGRVIEKASGMRYGDYVKKAVLAPLGITKARLARSLLSERAPGEVRYHSDKTAQAVMGPKIGKDVPTPYGTYSLETMDSCSGWVMTAAEAATFVSAFHDPSTCKILKAATVEEMFAPPKGDEKAAVSYCKGWVVRRSGDGKRTYWHDGLAEGLSTMFVQRSDGLAMAILFNSKEEVEKLPPSAAVEAALHKAANAAFGKR